jgi:hypothetical protein
MHQLKTCRWTAFRGLRRMELLRRIEPLVADSYCCFFEYVHRVTQVPDIGPIVHVPKPLLFKRNHSNAVSASWNRWETCRLPNAWIAARSRVLSAALPAARHPGDARDMLRIMAERTALDAEVTAGSGVDSCEIRGLCFLYAPSRYLAVSCCNYLFYSLTGNVSVRDSRELSGNSCTTRTGFCSPELIGGWSCSATA